MNKTFGTLLAVVIVASATFGAWRYFVATEYEHDESVEEHVHSDHIEMDEEKAISHGITTHASGPGKLEVNLALRGKVTLHPDLIAHILPKVSGVVKEARKNRGDSVTAGEVIAVLESREMAETKANFLAALEKAKLAQSIYQREEHLFQMQVTSEQDYLNAKANWQDASIHFQLARQKLLAFGLKEEEISSKNDDLRLYEVRSPIKGTIIDRDITFGEYVAESTPIYTVADLDTVWVEVGVYSQDFQKVKEGQVVKIALPDDSLSAQGKIVYVSQIIDSDTITANAVVEIENKERNWKPGAFVVAKINVETIIAPVTVTKKAVQVIDGESIIFVRTEAGFEKTVVRLGRSDEDHVEIIAGLNSGDKYAASGAFILKADLGKDSVEHED